jgi:hypothetical protein
MDLSLVKFLGDIVFKLLGLNAERKKEVAVYMESIAQTIGQFGPRLREGALTDELLGYVSETQQLAASFVSATSDVLPEDIRKELAEQLWQAFNAKDHLIKSAEDREQWFILLGEIAGVFRGAAATLKASANKFG